MPRWLIILRSAERRDAADLARALAGLLPPRSAVVTYGDIAQRWLVLGDGSADEEGLCYRLLKLACISLLKEGYSTVVEAPFSDVAGERERADLARLAPAMPGVQVRSLRLLPEGADAEATAARERLRHAATPDEILIEGSGGDLRTFARLLLERITAL